MSARVRRVSRLKVLKKALCPGRMKSTLLYSLVHAGEMCVRGGRGVGKLMENGKLFTKCITQCAEHRHEENLTLSPPS